MNHKFSINQKLKTYIGLSLLNEDEVDSQKEQIADFGSKYELHKIDDNSDRIYYWYKNFPAQFIKENSKKSNEIEGTLKSVATLGIIIAFLVGVIIASFIFSYDGTVPINVLSVITFFVVIPLLLLLISFIIQAVYPKGIEEYYTPINFLKRKVTDKITSLYPNLKDDVHSGKLNEFNLVDSKPLKLYVNKVIQILTIAYISGALCWMLLNVTTTDLAFSWSSTLNVEADNIYKITSVISKPWESIFPTAVINHETIEQTQFYRAENADLIERSSGEWWSFIFLTIFVYGLTPRLLLYGFYNWKLRGAIDSQITDKEISNTVINYLQKRSVHTPDKDVIQKYPDRKITEPPPYENSSCIIAWNLSDHSEEKLRSNAQSNVLKFINLSNLDGQSKLTDKIKTIISLITNNKSDLIVYVKYWESMNKRLENILKIIANEIGSSKIFIRPVYDSEDEGELKKNKTNWRARVDLLNNSLGKKIVFFEHANAVKLKDAI